MGQRTVAAAVVLGAWVSMPAPAGAQDVPDVTIWDGVYSSAQAERGRSTFETTCARCHNPELTGSERGPALTGDTFLSHWVDGSLEPVFNKIRDAMPPLGPNTLSPDIKIDVLAYILHRNNLPAGAADLAPVSPSLDAIQFTRKGIWNGLYTDAQAMRGKTTFETACIRCHGADLKGTTAPPLVGDPFLDNWQTGTIGSLFTKIRDTMPPNFGTILEPEAKLDIVTYILQANEFPAGREELTVDASETLDVAQILRKGAAAVVPNFALVQMVGCLAPGPDNAWTLTRSNTPVVTRNTVSTPDGLKSAATRPLGADTYTLVSAAPFRPAARSGQKVEAKGLLYREPGDNRLNLTSLETVAPYCR
jgi:mono/diheme cytochrome c family protein